ncbi:MAG TPA: arginase family protein [Plantibacter sp.]|uniref:arginase family protein n=1 Tax=Plantibacter sp. TaxID=1871045 RepID=UPI002D079495|nr:arginase family protein [Plantibacter sp.]
MRVIVLGVPSSAGAYCVGVERAPAALREAGLIEALRAAGNEVVDAGDLTTRRWFPDHESPYAQNLNDEAAAMVELSAAAAERFAAGGRLLVLGGSCTVAFGMCAAMAQLEQTPRIVYIDRHFDLNTPSSTKEGSLSWMGVAHALALDTAAIELSNATGHAPVLHPSNLVYLGVDPAGAATDWERERVADLGLALVDQTALCGDPQAAARQARSRMTSGPFVVHLDVDVLDFLDAPIAENVNGRNSGPTIDQLECALLELLQAPDCWGMSIAQLDPAHAASDPTAIPRLVSAIAAALTTDER